MAAVTSAGRASDFEPFAAAADSSAAAALYERHSGRVFGYCLSRLGRREDAEDAVQTTFLHAVRGLRRGVVPATEVAWLLGIARNVCLSRWESVSRRSRLESPCDPHQLDRGSAAPEGNREALIGVEDALRQLPDQQRRAVLLRDWRGLSYDEVAAQLGVSRAAVETLIFRGRSALADLLHEEPQATRRRLRSLGDLGSLLAGVKTAFSGSAAATKIALATAAAVAISGTGALVVGPSLRAGEPGPLQAPPAASAEGTAAVSSVAPERPFNAGRRPRSEPVAPRAAAPRSSAPATKPARTTVTPAVSPSPAASATPAVETPADPARTPASSEPKAASNPPETQPAPAAAAAPPASERTSDVLPVVTTAVNETVNTLLPNLPVQIPELPLPAVQLPDLLAVNLVLDIVEAVPEVVAIVPVTVTLPPVLITPPKLLP